MFKSEAKKWIIKDNDRKINLDNEKYKNKVLTDIILENTELIKIKTKNAINARAQLLQKCMDYDKLSHQNNANIDLIVFYDREFDEKKNELIELGARNTLLETQNNVLRRALEERNDRVSALMFNVSALTQYTTSLAESNRASIREFTDRISKLQSTNEYLENELKLNKIDTEINTALREINKTVMSTNKILYETNELMTNDLTNLQTELDQKNDEEYEMI